MYINCPECDHPIKVDTFNDEFGLDADWPEKCPACGEPIYTEETDFPEDFCQGT